MSYKDIWLEAYEQAIANNWETDAAESWADDSVADHRGSEIDEAELRLANLRGYDR